MEGGYTVYLRSVRQTYFVLRADPETQSDLQTKENNEDEGKLKVE